MNCTHQLLTGESTIKEGVCELCGQHIVQELYVYHGTCLGCGNTWRLTPEQVEVSRIAEICYSPCCEQPATLIKVKGRRT
jgi:hypothetical protein